MIYRLIDRTDTNKVALLAAPFDGMNGDEIVALAQTLAPGWVVVPDDDPSILRLMRRDLADPDPLEIYNGYWFGAFTGLSGGGVLEESAVRAGYYLADDELHL